jgi:hypothetical protein
LECWRCNIWGNFVKHIFTGLVAVSLFTCPVATQAQMVDAAQIRPILDATKNNWVAVREWNGRDLVYFTHLLTWRCGLTKIQYSINSTVADQNWAFIPCDETSPTPTALPPGQKIYGSFKLNSIQTLTVKITYDDGGVDTVTYQRDAIQIQ